MAKLNLTLTTLICLLLASAPALAVAPAPAASATQPVNAVTAAATGTTDTDSGDDKPGPPSIFDDAQRSTNNYASMVVRIHTPQNQSAQDTFTLYPYPPKPPAATKPGPLPVDFKSCRAMCMGVGYGSRPTLDKPYPPGGYRWMYAYQAGLRKSGLGEPKTLLSLYQWADDIAPYVAHECRIRNQFESERWKRYENALGFYQKNHVDLENEAVRLGLNPIQLNHRIWSMGKAEFPPGSWWLQVTRKAPGITYYWLQPLTVASSQHVELVLDENNALVMKGGW